MPTGPGTSPPLTNQWEVGFSSTFKYLFKPDKYVHFDFWVFSVMYIFLNYCLRNQVIFPVLTEMSFCERDNKRRHSLITSKYTEDEDDNGDSDDKCGY